MTASTDAVIAEAVRDYGTGNDQELIGALAAMVAEARKDSARLDWLERNPHNLLAHRFDDGTFGFFGRFDAFVVWPLVGTEPWQDLRAAIDAAMDAASPSTPHGGHQK